MKKIITIIIIFSLILALNGCVMEGRKNYESHADLIHIDNQLYYYNDTKIVYIVFNENTGYAGYGYMSPYYSSNGNLCKYDTNTHSIVEIEN